jgi:hypothetical protein
MDQGLKSGLGTGPRRLDMLAVLLTTALAEARAARGARTPAP